MSRSCAFREITGPLQPGCYWYPSIRPNRPFVQHIKQVFVERATCGWPGHAFHYVAEMTSSDFGDDGWMYAVTGKEGLRRLQRYYGLAPGFTSADARLVLCPLFDKEG